MEIDYIHRFITSMLFTTTVETLVLVVFLACVLKKKNISIKEFIFAGYFASFATIPYVWFVFPYVAEWSRSISSGE